MFVGVAGVITAVAIVVAFWVVCVVVAVPVWTVRETMLMVGPLSVVTGGATLSVDDMIAAVACGVTGEPKFVAQEANIVEAQDEPVESTFITSCRFATEV